MDLGTLTSACQRPLRGVSGVRKAIMAQLLQNSISLTHIKPPSACNDHTASENRRQKTITTVLGPHAAVKSPRPSSKTSSRGPHNMHGVLIILGNIERGLCPTEPLRMLNKPSAELVGHESAPQRKGDAVRSVPYLGPDHCNCRKSYCRRKAGCWQGSQPPQPGLAVTIPSVEVPAVRQANLDWSSPRTTQAAMGALRHSHGSLE
jgi:hypothetical protein